MGLGDGDTGTGGGNDVMGGISAVGESSEMFAETDMAIEAELKVLIMVGVGMVGVAEISLGPLEATGVGEERGRAVE